MSSGLAYPPAFIPPAHLWVPEARRGSYGPEVVDFTNSIGHRVDAEQAADIDTLASYGPGGTYLTLETAYLESRQNGKTDRVGLPLALADVWLWGSSLTWTAHRIETVQSVFTTVQRLIEANESLSCRVKQIIEQRAQWAVELLPQRGQDEGAVMEFRIRGGGGGRGIPRDIWVVDEALYVDATSMGDRLPTLSSKPNPQVRYYSSACKKASTQLRKLVRRGRVGGDPSLIYVERCAPGSFAEPGCAQGRDCRHIMGTPGCTLDREDLLHLANHRVSRRPGASYQFLKAERRTLAPTEYARERFGWHEDGPDDDARHPLSSSDWEATTAEESPDRVSPMFYIAIGPEGDAVIAVAADRPAPPASADFVERVLYDTRPHVELADSRPGSAWLGARLVELAKAWPDAVFGAGKAGPVAGMAEAGLGVSVELLPSAELAQACRHHEQLNKLRGYTHSADPDVDLSFAGAVSKPAGDGMWTWDWRESTGLAPIAAETGALWLLEKYRGGGPAQQFFGTRR